MAKRKEGIVRRIESKVTAEADRVIASTETAVRQGTATLERRFDRMEANLASRSSGRDDLLQRLVGQPGSSKEIQAEIDARKENLKRKRREEREEDKQAEKRRKLEQLLEIPLEEGDTLQDGVVLRGDLGRRKMHGLQAVGDFPFGRLRCCLVAIGETATLQLDPLNDQQLTVLESMTGSNHWLGTVVKVLAVMKDGTVEEAQFLKQKLCGPNRKPIKPLAVRFTSSRFVPSRVFAPKPAEEPVEPAQPVEPAPVEPVPVEPTQPDEPMEPVEPAQPDEPMEPVQPVEPDVEMSAQPAEEPDAEMTEKPADEDLESTAASSGGVELWELPLKGSTVRFSVDRVTSVSPLGRERLITPVKEDLGTFQLCQIQGLRDLRNGQFLLSARLWNQSVTKASSPTVSATASEAPAEAAPEAAPEAPAEEAPEAAPEAPAQEAPEAAPEAPAEEAPEAASEAPAEEVSEAASEAPAEEARTYPSGEVERGGLAGFDMDGEGNFQLKASTLQEYREALPILQERMADGSVDSCRLMVGVEKGKERWNKEKQPYQITRNNKLMLPKAKKSVAPEDAIVEIHWA